MSVDETVQPQKRLGKLPAKGDVRTLMFARFVQLDRIPTAYNPWKRRTPFMPRTFGNNAEGCCTKASQALAAMRFERLETKRTVGISDAEIHRVYREGVRRHYGTDEDMGMYELDALSDFRRPEHTFRDAAGHPITIDAFAAVNPRSNDEVRAAIALSGKWGIKICLNLPIAFARIDPPYPWDVPKDQPLTGEWMPGSWGGHSLFVDRYNANGVTMVHSWYEGQGIPKSQWPVDEQVITWTALSAYCDESYWLVDSVDFWRKRATAKEKRAVDVSGIVKAVNKVSRHKIK